MWSLIRRLLVPVFSLTLAASGLAYAAQHEAFNVSSHGEDSTTLGSSDGQGDDLQDGQDPTGSSHQTGTARSTEGCPEGFTGNHGQFVSGAEGSRSDAAHSPCGKPVQAVDHPTGQTTEPEGDEAESENEQEASDDNQDGENESSGPNEHSNGHANGHASAGHQGSHEEDGDS